MNKIILNNILNSDISLLLFVVIKESQNIGNSLWPWELATKHIQNVFKFILVDNAKTVSPLKKSQTQRQLCLFGNVKWC